MHTRAGSVHRDGWCPECRDGSDVTVVRAEVVCWGYWMGARGGGHQLHDDRRDRGGTNYSVNAPDFAQVIRAASTSNTAT